MGHRIFFTICSANYLAYARTLGQSLCAAHPGADFRIVMADSQAALEQAGPIEFPVVTPAELGLETRADMALRYSVMEFNTALKPFALRYFLAEPATDQAIFLDPDILVVSAFEELLDLLDTDGVDGALTPHACVPPGDDAAIDDIRLLRTGAYNLGFCAFVDTPATTRFLNWWAARLSTQCIVDLEAGLFVDQKFMDLAPSYLAGLRVFSNPGYNAAYWNLAHRPVTRDAKGAWHAGGSALRFFHFSGVAPEDRTVFSRHQTRYQATDLGALRPLLDTYLEQINDAGHSHFGSIAYGFDTYGNIRLDPFVRRVYRHAFPEPPTASPTSAELTALCRAPSSFSGFNRYCAEIWESRPDLQRAYPLNSRSGRRAFRAWLYSHGLREHRLQADFLPARNWLDQLYDRTADKARRLRAAASGGTVRS